MGYLFPPTLPVRSTQPGGGLVSTAGLFSPSNMATTDSVLHIVQAFTRSLDILRERRRKKKSAKISRGKAGLGDSSGDELRLSKSLRQGPVDIQREYERHYKDKGDSYAIGDGKLPYLTTSASGNSEEFKCANTCM